MLRRTSAVSRSVGRWAAQVVASIGATLAATLIYAALPHASGGDAAPRPELTAGGKFAARAEVPAAYDGLDSMPLPRVVPAISLPEPPPTSSSAPVHRGPAPRAPRPVRVAARVPERRLAAAIPDPTTGVLAASAPAAEGEGGALPRVWPAIASTARDAWRFTASAGDALVARMVPQIP